MGSTVLAVGPRGWIGEFPYAYASRNSAITKDEVPTISPFSDRSGTFDSDETGNVSAPFSVPSFGSDPVWFSFMRYVGLDSSLEVLSFSRRCAAEGGGALLDDVMLEGMDIPFSSARNRRTS